MVLVKNDCFSLNIQNIKNEGTLFSLRNIKIMQKMQKMQKKWNFSADTLDSGQSMTCNLFWLAVPTTPQPKSPPQPATCIFEGCNSQPQLYHILILKLQSCQAIRLFSNCQKSVRLHSLWDWKNLQCCYCFVFLFFLLTSDQRTIFRNNLCQLNSYRFYRPWEQPAVMMILQNQGGK